MAEGQEYQQQDVVITYPAIRNLTIAVNLLQSTLAPVEAAPFTSSIDFVPRAKTGQILVNISSESQEDSVSPNFAPEFRNPDLRKAPARTWLNNNIENVLSEPPFVPVRFPNPELNKKIRPDWQQFRPFYYEEPAKPLTRFEFQNPELEKIPIKDWIFSRKIDEPEGFGLTRQTDWPIPLRKKTQAITWIAVRNNVIPNLLLGNERLRWPNPVLRPKRAIPWIDYYIFDETPPPPNLNPGASTFVLPQRKRFYNATWIYTNRTAVITSAGQTKTFDWPNPVRIKRSTLTEINNLIQSPFAVPQGDKPFFEDKWPNPLIGLRNFHSGITDGRKFYFEEPPLQIAQYDWPVFRVKTRNAVGWIYSQKQESEPQFTTSDTVPLRKKVIALSFIDNPLRTITAPTGEKPFAQYDWPIFVRAKRFTDLLTWLGQNPQILPQILGRIICLQINEEEYFLEMSAEDFDLEMRSDDFDLDMGGEECE